MVNCNCCHMRRKDTEYYDVFQYSWYLYAGMLYWCALNKRQAGQAGKRTSPTVTTVRRQAKASLGKPAIFRVWLLDLDCLDCSEIQKRFFPLHSIVDINTVTSTVLIYNQAGRSHKHTELFIQIILEWIFENFIHRHSTIINIYIWYVIIDLYQYTDL